MGQMSYALLTAAVFEQHQSSSTQKRENNNHNTKQQICIWIIGLPTADREDNTDTRHMPGPWTTVAAAPTALIASWHSWINSTTTHKQTL
jgi:hypothetical protein